MQKLLTWIDDRFPLTALWESQWGKYVAPKNFNFWYYFGSLAAFVLVLQIVTGIFLTMSYKPDAAKAFESVEYIMRDVSWGWLIRYMHSTGASMFFIVVYLHMFRGLMYGSYRKPRELTWIFGCLIYLCLMAEAFFGYLLPWGQMSYWGAQVIVNLFSAVPIIGEDLGVWIRGDYTISDITLNRFFAFHVVAVPLVLLGLVAAHLMALHETGSNNPDGIEIKKQPKDPATGLPLDGIYSHPYYTVKDIVGVVVFLAVFSAIMFFVPDMGGYFLEANNFIPADPLKTPEHIAPVWYFTPYYAMLRAVPSFLGSQFWGVIVMGAAVMIFFALPWLDRGAVKSIRYRGTTLQGVAGGVRRELPDPGLSRRRPGHGLGPVSRRLAAARHRRSRDRRRPRAHHHLFPVLPADALVHRARQDEAGAGEGDRMTTCVDARFCSPRSCIPRRGAGAALASGGNDIRMEPAPINRLDLASQQRGARTFVNYCLNCHTAKYMRYNRLTDLGLTEAQIRDNLMFATDKIGETMNVAMRPADAKAWFGVTPPGPHRRGAGARRGVALQLLPRLLPGRERADRLEQPPLSERRDAARARGAFRHEPARHHGIQGSRGGAGCRARRQGHRRARARQGPHLRRGDARRRNRPARSARSSTSRWSPISSTFSTTWASRRRTSESASGSSCCSTWACCSSLRTG